MNTDFKRVLDFYDKSSGGELDRSERPSSRFELRRALSVFEKHFQPPADVLDLGAGSGRYTVELAKLGFRMTLAELSPALLAVARERIAEAGVTQDVAACDEVNAIDLSRYPDESFDVVLCFGPFYHLVAQHERLQAAKEIARVLRPGGTVVAMFIPLLTGLNGFVWRGAAKPDQFTVSSLREVYETGTFVNANPAAKDQQIMHFMRSNAMQNLFEEAGFATHDLVSLRGYTRGFEQYLFKIEEQNPELFEEYVRIIEETCRETSSIELGGQALYVGKK